MSAAPLKFLASAPRGFGDLLAQEMLACGATDSRERSGDVAFTGSLAVAYRACLWSRIANRVFLEVAQFEAATTEEFLAAVTRIDWACLLYTSPSPRDS